VPLSWLRDYVSVDLAPDELAVRLTVLGMEVKSIERWGADWQNVVVGELLAVEKHPRADRLSLTRVTLGDGEPLEIVCGATNIAPGQRVPVALPGAVLPGARRIERTEKMGVVSNGMLCSGEELRLTADGEGILILPGDSPLGAALTDLYGDWVLDVDVKPNRGDALSLTGLAREVAAATGAEVAWPPTDVVEAGRPIDERLAVEVVDPELCPRFVGRWLSGVAIGPSPDRVQMRLLAAGMRPVSNVVDASNYVMLELGKPTHTFDAAAVRTDAAGRAVLVVRPAQAGERIETLDHIERDLNRDTLLIADAGGPLGIAGVIGGANSEVGGGTTDIIIESAIFDPVSIRRTGQRFALRSEASLRFEKGQEVRLARLGADRVARLTAEWAGGDVAPGRIDTAPAEPEPIRLPFRPARVNRLLGTNLGVEEQRSLLERVGVAIEPAEGPLVVPVALAPTPLVAEPTPGEAIVAVVPTWRRDLVIEADIAEEVARVRGYETVPSILPHTPMPQFRRTPLEARDAIRRALAGAGLTEVVTHALVSPRHVEAFPPLIEKAVPPGEESAGGDPILVTNPLSSQHSVLRQSLFGSLIDVVGTNVRHGREDVAIFEVGKGYGRTVDGPREWWRLGIALAGASRPTYWRDPARPWDIDDAKGLVELIANLLGFAMPRYTPLPEDPRLHPGRSARVSIPFSGGWTAADPADVAGWVDLSGRLGELHPSVIDAWEVRVERVVIAEIAITGLSGGPLRRVLAAAPSRHPTVERDVAIIVAEGRAAGDVARAIETHGGPLLRDVRLFDVYRGNPLTGAEKSLAFRLVFGADRTLTDDEIDAAMRAIVDGVGADVAGRPRV
jgi:phenylalanyl-tRNA synthetase beta chain